LSVGGKGRGLISIDNAFDKGIVRADAENGLDKGGAQKLGGGGKKGAMERTKRQMERGGARCLLGVSTGQLGGKKGRGG